jgi:AraC-like DNA-binding protein
MTSDGVVRFWQPAPQAANELACAYLEIGRARAHVHEEWQFAVAEGPGKLSVGAFRRYAARATDLTAVPPYDVHTEASGTGPSPRWRVLYVAPSLVNRVYRGVVGRSSVDPPRLAVPVLADPAAAAELRGLLQESEEGKIEGSEFLTRALRWVETLLRRHAADAPTPARMPAVERARTYLRDRPTQAVSLLEVGAIAGVTVSHLVRSFSRAVGLPPKSYHAQVRLARARRLLAQGKSATWVAYECGFADQSHLSRRFKECYGLTPGVFQSQYRDSRAATGLDSNAA